MLYRSVSGYSIENSIISSSQLPKRNENLTSWAGLMGDFHAGARSFSELNQLADCPALSRPARVKNAPYSSAEVSEKIGMRRPEGTLKGSFPTAESPF